MIKNKSKNKTPGPRSRGASKERVEKRAGLPGSGQQTTERICRLLSGLSHDLRTPLTILKGGIEVALMRDRTPEDYRRLLRSNLEEIERLTRIVDDFLALTQKEAER